MAKYVWVPSRKEAIRVTYPLISGTFPLSSLTRGLEDAGVGYEVFDDKGTLVSYLEGLGITDSVTWKRV